MPAHGATAVANEVIRRARARGLLLTPMQVQKLVYLCHGWMLGLYQRALICDSVEAWQYGPVIPAVYHALKHYGGNHVREPIPFANDKFDAQEADVISQVVNLYGDWDGIALSNWTHRVGSPWYITWNEGGRGSPIPTDLIQAYFSRLANEPAKH